MVRVYEEEEEGRTGESEGNRGKREKNVFEMKGWGLTCGTHVCSDSVTGVIGYDGLGVIHDDGSHQK